METPADCRRSRTRNVGFTLVEVLVALMIAAVFTSLTMQALVTAAAYRSKAAQYDEAVSWIQEDLETVVSQARQYEADQLPHSTICSERSPRNGMAARFITDNTPAGLGATPGQPAELETRALGGQPHTLNRTAVFETTSDPLRLIELIYTVTSQTDDPPIAMVRTEVIPYSVLRCP